MDNTVRELESCSLALLDALRREQPSYLEHLGRRRELLAKLASSLPRADAQLRAALERIWVVGGLIEQQVRGWQTAAERERAAVAQDRAIVTGLRAIGRPHQVLFSVKL